MPNFTPFGDLDESIGLDAWCL